MKLGTLIGALSLFSVSAVSVQADNLRDDVTDTETTEDTAEDTIYSRLRGNNLSFGNMKISKLSNQQVNIYGLTQCYHECDEVWLQIYLEQKNDGSYGTYKYWKYHTTDATSLSKSLNVLVPTGHYYRVRGYHAAKDGSKESTETLTSGIWVGD